jgi:A/G-specific adenine glycosylase
MDSTIAQDIIERVLQWYDHHRRLLPWRRDHTEAANPYYTWLSEIMLQQTTVATVHKYFHQFIATWPTLSDLAAATEQEVLTLWQGLGYYSRARNLLKCAQLITRDFSGAFPQTTQALLTLPGIGHYTAAAIAAIAFKQPEVPVDGNIKRVIARLLTLKEADPILTKRVMQEVQTLKHNPRPGDFAQALMDLGALICTARAPKCLQCPLQHACQAYQQGVVALYPTAQQKPEKPTRYGHAYVVIDNDNILLRQRPEKGVLAQMIEVPGPPWGNEPDPNALAPFNGSAIKACGQVKHTFTHFHLKLDVYSSQGLSALPDNTFWHPLNQLDALPIPTVMKKVIERGLGSGQPG